MSWWMWVILFFVVCGMLGKSKGEKSQTASEQEAARRRKEAEDYIMNSGDKEAIKQLMLARATAPTFNQGHVGGAASGGSNAVKTGAAVMGGVVAGQVIADAVAVSAISNALSDIQSNSGDSEANFTDLFS